MSDILHMTVDQLKSELTSLGVSQLQGLTKPDLQEELCKTLSIEVNPSQLQGLVTLATLDKASPNHSNHSSNANSPVKSDVKSCNETKFTSDQLFALEKLRIEMQMRKDELEIQIRDKEMQAKNEIFAFDFFPSFILSSSAVIDVTLNSCHSC